MRHDDIVQLLALISSTDGRKLGRHTPAAWMEILGDYEYADCRAAVIEHFRTSTDWLTPAHIVRAVKAQRGKRLKAIGGPVQPNRADHAAGSELEARRTLIEAVASGRMSAEEYAEYAASDIRLADWGSRQLPVH